MDDSISPAAAQSLGRLLLRAARAFGASVSARLQARGHRHVRMSHATLLLNLELGGARIGVLAARAGMTKQAMGQLVRELEQLGYLERRSDPDDRRATLVQLTPVGWRVVLDLQEVISELEAEFQDHIGYTAMRQLQNNLGALIRSDSVNMED